jgi:hypothetical protein
VKPAALLELANADLDREHAAILAPVARLERHRLAGTDSVRQPGDERLVQVRIELARIASNQLLAAIAQARAGLPVDVDHGQLLVMQKKRVRRMVGERAEARFARAQRSDIANR